MFLANPLRIIPSHVSLDVLVMIAAATLRSGQMKNHAIFMALLLAGQMNGVQFLGPRNVKNVSSNFAYYKNIFKSFDHINSSW